MNSSFSFWQTFSSSFRVLAQELSYFPGLPTPTVKKVEVRRQKRLTPTIPSLVDTGFYIVTWASISSFSCWSSANVTDFLRAAVKYLVSPLGSKQVCPLTHFSSFCDCCTNFVSLQQRLTKFWTGKGWKLCFQAHLPGLKDLIFVTPSGCSDFHRRSGSVTILARYRRCLRLFLFDWSTTTFLGFWLQ